MKKNLKLIVLIAYTKIAFSQYYGNKVHVSTCSASIAEFIFNPDIN